MLSQSLDSFVDSLVEVVVMLDDVEVNGGVVFAVVLLISSAENVSGASLDFSSVFAELLFEPHGQSPSQAIF